MNKGKKESQKRTFAPILFHGCVDGVSARTRTTSRKYHTTERRRLLLSLSLSILSIPFSYRRARSNRLWYTASFQPVYSLAGPPFVPPHRFRTSTSGNNKFSCVLNIEDGDLRVWRGDVANRMCVWHFELLLSIDNLFFAFFILSYIFQTILFAFVAQNCTNF